MFEENTLQGKLEHETADVRRASAGSPTNVE